MDEWKEPEEVESENAVEVVGEIVSLEGKIEDFDEPENCQASANPILTENDDDSTNSLAGGANHKTATTPGIDETPQQLAQPAVAVEVVSRCGKCIQEEEARDDFEMIESTRKAEEKDHVSALWLSDPENDDADEVNRAMVTTTNEVTI